MSLDITEYGITEEGFVRKPFSIIRTEMMETAKQNFGPDVDLRPQSAIMNWIEVHAVQVDQIWSIAESIYYAQFISTAEGDALDLHGEPLATTRKRQIKSSGVLAFRSSGGLSTTVPTESIAESPDGVQFITSSEITIVKGSESSPKGIGTVTRTTSVDYLPQPYDLNNNLSLMWVASSANEIGTIYVYSDATNDNYSYGYRDNVGFFPRSIDSPRAYLVWQSAARTLFTYNIANITDPVGDRPGDNLKTTTGPNMFTNQNDIIYIGCGSKFSQMTFNLNALVPVSQAIEIEYYSQSAADWQQITKYTDGCYDSGAFRQDGTIQLNWTKTEWLDWITTTTTKVTGENALESAYYIRIRLTTAPGLTSTLTGTPGITINNGQVPSVGGSYHIGAVGNQWEAVNSIAVLGGTSGNVNADSIVTITRSIGGVTQVINQNGFVGGVDTEDDGTFRSRMLARPRSFFAGDYIKAAIEGISGVETAVVDEGRKQDTITISSSRLIPAFIAWTYNEVTNAFTSHDTFISDLTNLVQPFATGAYTSATQADFITFGSLTKFTRLEINVATAVQYIAAGATWQFWAGSVDKWQNISNVRDDTDSALGPLTQNGSVVLQMTVTEYNSWTETYTDVPDFGEAGLTPSETINNKRFFVRCRLNENITGNTLGEVRRAVLYDESVILRKGALDPGSHTGISRVTVFRPSTQAYTVISSETADNQPALISVTQFWCDYQNPSMIYFYKDVLEANDVVLVNYIDASVGSAFYNCIVLPTSSPLDDNLSTNIHTELVNITPIGVGFKVLEATPLVINIHGTLVYDTVNYDLSSLNDNIFNRLFDNYFRLLTVGEIVYRNRLIQYIMQEPGVVDIEELVIQIVGEYHNGSAVVIDLVIAKIAPFATVGGGAYGTTIELDADGNEIYGEITNTDGQGETTVENAGGTTDSSTVYYGIIDPTETTKGQVQWNNDNSFLNANVQWKITYYSNEDNISTPANSIAKIGSVNFA